MGQRAGAGTNSVRIIGGDFRGRKLAFPDIPGLRPTTDRVRETLFNWLQPMIQGADCLDLFAGSGAFGLESLSRGAGFVHFVDASPQVTRQLSANTDLLGLSAVSRVTQGDGLRLLRRHDQPDHAGQMPQRFDLVFLDPPFESSADQLLSKACQLLVQQNWLKANALVYLEQDSHQPWPDPPEDWSLHREGKAGQATFRLMKTD